MQLMLAHFLSCIQENGNYRIVPRANESLWYLAKVLQFRSIKLECVPFACGLIKTQKNNTLSANKEAVYNFLTKYDQFEFQYNVVAPPLCNSKNESEHKVSKLKVTYQPLIKKCIREHEKVICVCITQKRRYCEVEIESEQISAV